MRLKLFEEFNSELTNLINILKRHDIPVDLWGTGKSKTINHLLKELQNSECSLEEENESITRYIEFVGIKVYYIDKEDQRWILKEERQEFNDGRVRRRNIPNSVSEKMKFGENPTFAAIRGIKEELGVDINSNQLSKYSDLHYDGGSVSYPGLDTKYKGHKFICNLTETQFEPNGYIEVQEDKKTFFTWKKI
jgi:hypothetical protein